MVTASERSKKSYFLKQFGVDEWFVRKPLQGAAPSRIIYIESDDALRLKAPDTSATLQNNRPSAAGTKQSLSNPITPSSNQRAYARDMLVTLGGEGTQSASQSPAEEQQTKLRSPEIESNATPPLRPALTTTKHKSVALELPLSWLVVKTDSFFMLSDVESDPIISGVEMLSRNILDAMSSINPALSSSEVSIQYFAWPIFSNEQVPGNDLTAMISLFTSRFGAVVNENGLQVIVMGAKACSFVESCFSSPSSKKHFMSSISLSDMLDNPSLKANFWHSVLESPLLQI
jgi:hypothetical protein